MVQLAKRLRASESGQSLLEFALVFPLFVVLVLAAIEFGWVGYQRVSFDYACSHANWGTVVDAYKNQGEYDDVNATVLTSGVDAKVKEAVDASGWYGMDKNSIVVSDARATLSSNGANYKVPDHQGTPVDATQYTRHMRVTAHVTYNVKPIVGFFVKETGVTRDIDFDQVIGQERRSY